MFGVMRGKRCQINQIIDRCPHLGNLGWFFQPDHNRTNHRPTAQPVSYTHLTLPTTPYV